MRTVILAAGMGARLGAGKPKGFLPIGSTTFIERSIGLLQSFGLGPVTLVVGYGADHFRQLPGELGFVDNPDFATTGSLKSLMLAHRVLQDDLLVLESDLLYEPRALEQLLACDEPNAILTSGFTGAGDEVWVDAPGGWLRGMSKTAADLNAPPEREFVGICRFSRSLLDAMDGELLNTPTGHYETDGVVPLAHQHRVWTVHVPDLIWCEVDDAHHLDRAKRLIAPRLLG